MQTDQPPTPLNDPDARHAGDRYVHLKWNVGQPTNLGRPQARLYVMYIKNSGYVSALDIVQVKGATETSYPFGPKVTILTETATRFARTAFGRAIDNAVARLRLRFQDEDPVVLTFFDPDLVAKFDGTPQSIGV